MWVSDHVIPANANVANFGEAVFDPLVTLAIAAGATSRVKLGTTAALRVEPKPLRQPMHVFAPQVHPAFA